MSSEYYTLISTPLKNSVQLADPQGNYLGDLVQGGDGFNSPGEGGLLGPDGLAIGTDQNLYVGTVLGKNVLRYVAKNGEFIDEFIATGKGGFEPDDGLGSVTHIKFGPDGNLYLSNFISFITFDPITLEPQFDLTQSDNLLVFNSEGEFVTQYDFPNGGSVTPLAIEFIGNRLLVSSRTNDIVYTFEDITQASVSEANDLTPFIDGNEVNIPLDGPAGLLFASDELLYVSSLDSDQIQRYNPENGDFIDIFVDETDQKDIIGPTALKETPDNQEIFVTGFTSANAGRIDFPTGEVIDVFIPVGGDETWGFAKNEGLLVAEPEILGDTIVTVDIQGEPSNINSSSSFPITVEFSEDVSGFEVGDILVDNGMAENFNVIDGNTYTATIVPDRTGNITLDIPREVANSNTGNINIAAETASVIIGKSLYVSNVNNTGGVGAVVNINLDANGNIDSAGPNFEPGVYYSSVLEYDAVTGSFLGEFVPKGSASQDAIFFSSGITFNNNILYANDQGYQVDSTVTNPEDSHYGRILTFDATTGKPLGEFISGADLTANGLNFPEDLLFGPDGDLYISGLGGGGVQKFDGTTGTYEETIIDTNPVTGTDLIAAGLNFGPDGNLYISSVLNDNSIFRYNLETKAIDQFITPENAPAVPSGSTFTPDGSLFLDGTFISVDETPVNVQQYDATTGEPQGYFVDPSNNGGLNSASRMVFDENSNLYISDFNGSQVVRFDSVGNPVDGGIFVASGVGGLNNPGGLAFYASSEKDYSAPLPSPIYRFRNTTYETGSYLFVGAEEKDSILNNPDFNQTFVLEGDGNPAFDVSFEQKDDLLGFYRLASLETPGTYLSVGQEEYNNIFAENSDQKDKWIKEGLDSEGNDIPDLYTYGVGANQGLSFNRFRNQENGTYLFAGPEESESILNTPSLANLFINEGAAFESLA